MKNLIFAIYVLISTDGICQGEHLGEPYPLRGPYTLEDRYKNYVEKLDTLKAISLDHLRKLDMEESSRDSVIDSATDYLSARENVSKILIFNPEFKIQEIGLKESLEFMKSMSDTLTPDEKIDSLRLYISSHSLEDAFIFNEYIKELREYKKPAN